MYEEFSKNFPQVGTSSTSGSHSDPTSLDVPATNELRYKQDHQLQPFSLTSSNRPETSGHEHISSLVKDLDPTPRPHTESWRFTPSILDVNSYAFTSFANQPPGYYTPTPGGTTFYHNQAGDLHTPGMGMGMGLGTPLSGPTSEAGMHSGPMMDYSNFGHNMAQHHFQNYDPFGHQPQQQSSYAPSSFIHQDTGYETMEQDGSPMEDEHRMGSMAMNLHNHQSPIMSYQPRYEMNMNEQLQASGEKFRFHVTLNAPTAMIKNADEIPVTYLNKGQAYSISVIDTAPVLPLPAGARYRTFIRISFEDEQQRARPATCWQLWKEGRGTNEAHQRGGKLQAVEYVEASQPAESDDKRTRVELDTASFDGFSVIWTPGANGSTDCNVAVRFNFLSTDFSHSKGVKGIPVRLCAKTELVLPQSEHATAEPGEVAFCKVKLFRDHGAERKLSNDVAHVKKTIDKLQQQIEQAETGMKDFSKRKRQGSTTTKAMPSQRPGKVPKHKRTWSISSASSSGGRVPMEEDLHYKLQTMQDMFTSTRPVSILYLRGAEQDDPDLHPVALAGEPLDLTKVNPNPVWQERSGRSSTAGTSSLISPSPSSISLQSQAVLSSSVHNSQANSVPQWGEFRPITTTIAASNTPSINQQETPSLPETTKVAKSDGTGNLSGWIEALGVDRSYQAPVERLIKPTACFYILQRDSPSDQHDNQVQIYRAVYLMQRTLKELTSAIAAKWNMEPTKIKRCTHVLPRGLEVEIDDDVVRELSEGQDMILEISKMATADSSPVKREWEMAVDASPVVDAEGARGASSTNVVQSELYDLRLFF